jgi:chemotaxis regulatin CheY-phosphate phosphatase CheZ
MNKKNHVMKKKWSFIILLAVSLFALTIMVANPALARKTGALISSVFEKKPTNTIKERILKMKEALEKDDEQLPEIIKETEKAAQNSKDSVEAAILHSMTAQMYDYYYDSHSWDINGRTDLNNYIPEDIREWTKNIFKDTIEKELEASLKPAALLQQTPDGKMEGDHGDRTG